MPQELLDQLLISQVYEVSRLLHFKEQQKLREFAQERESEVQLSVLKGPIKEVLRIVQGLTTLLPVRLQCSDGELSLYPGDSM